MLRVRRLLLSLACLLSCLPAVWAQPSIGTVTPQGLAPGATTTLKLNGGGLAGATQLWTSFGGTAVLATDVPDNGKNDGEVSWSVTVPDGVPAGIYGLRVVTDKGVSPLKFVVIDPLPVVAHANQNKSFETAQEIPVPAAVEGYVDNLSRIYFRFKAEANQKLSFDVQSRRLGSPLDPVLRLFDINGRELAWSDDEAGLQGDSQFSYTFQSPGEYVVELSDIRYQGGGNHRFRLRIGGFPLINTPYPMVAQYGGQTSVSFAGIDVEAVQPINGLQVVRIPGVPAPHVLWTPLSTPEGGFGVLGVSEAPQFVETEPNNAAEQANRVELGHHINGRFETAGDVDRFVFAAKKDQKFRFEAVTREAGSPADLFLQIYKPDGGKLAEVEDTGMEDGGVDFTCPADGDYTLVVRDLHRRGGSPFAYHVNVDEIRPGFTLTAAADTFNVPAGGVLAVQITAARKGYGGPIQVEARNLGNGLRSVPTVIGPGRNDAILTIEAASDAATGILSEALVVGTADVGGRTHEAAASIHDVLKGGNNALPWPARNLIHATAAAVAPAQPVSLRVGAPEVVLGQNLSATFKIVAERRDGWDADIALAINPEKNGLPGGITLAPQPIKAGSNEIELTVSANDKAALGEFTVVLTGTVKKDKATQTVSTPGITLKLQPQLSVAAAPTDGKVAKGGELKLQVTVNRNPALAAPVTVTAANLPKGVTAEPLTIPADQGAGEIVLKAAADAEAATADNVQLKAEAAVGETKFAADSPNLKVTVE